MRISDWSSDVCSSDLPLDFEGLVAAGETGLGNYVVTGKEIELRFVDGDVSRMRMLTDRPIASGHVDIHPPTFPPASFRYAVVLRSDSYTASGTGLACGVGSESKKVFRSDGTTPARPIPRPYARRHHG